MAKVFISYSHKDENWVRNWLVPRLEHAGIKTHVDWRDFEIGVPSDINMERAVETCEKTILVMTPAWVESQAAQLEAIMLQSQDRAGLKKKIMPLMLKDCRLPLRLRILTYADFRDEAERQSQIARVIAQIKKDFAELAPAKRQPPSLDRKYVDITSLPQTGYLLFGRTEQLKLLDESWESGAPNVLAFVAFGGVG